MPIGNLKVDNFVLGTINFTFNNMRPKYSSKIDFNLRRFIKRRVENNILFVAINVIIVAANNNNRNYFYLIWKLLKEHSVQIDNS
jgi:hypothetical protein